MSWQRLRSAICVIIIAVVTAACSGTSHHAGTTPSRPSTSPPRAPRAQVVALARKITLPSSFALAPRSAHGRCRPHGGTLVRCWSASKPPDKLLTALTLAGSATHIPATRACGPADAPKQQMVCRVDLRADGWSLVLSAFPVISTHRDSAGDIVASGHVKGSDVTLAVTSGTS